MTKLSSKYSVLVSRLSIQIIKSATEQVMKAIIPVQKISEEAGVRVEALLQSVSMIKGNEDDACE